MSTRTKPPPAVDLRPELPFDCFAPARPQLPVLISAPHSGQLLPVEVEAHLGVPLEALRELDDGPVHRLFCFAVDAGATMLVARFRRAFVDLNRDPLEIDPELAPDLSPSLAPRLSLRVRAGLGVIPSRLGNRRLYRAPLGAAEISRRLQLAWFPYHRALAEMLSALHRRFGSAVLLKARSLLPNESSTGSAS